MPLLKNVHRSLSAQLLFVLASMGHGDELVIADANFPAASTAKAAELPGGATYIDCTGLTGVQVLEAILSVFPLDQYVDKPAAVMARVDSDRDLPVPIWGEYKARMNAAEGKVVQVEEIERFAFYERAKKAYCVIATGEGAQYANLILKKGVVKAA